MQLRVRWAGSLGASSEKRWDLPEVASLRGGREEHPSSQGHTCVGQKQAAVSGTEKSTVAGGAGTHEADVLERQTPAGLGVLQRLVLSQCSRKF